MPDALSCCVEERVSFLVGVGVGVALRPMRPRRWRIGVDVVPGER